MILKSPFLFALLSTVRPCFLSPPTHCYIFQKIPDASPDTLLTSAEEHVAYIPTVLSCLSVQATALRVAASNLDTHVLSLSEVFGNFEPIAIKELDRQAELLRNHDFDLEVISKIRVHAEFLSPSVRKEVEAGVKERVLGDYVSNVKMKMVADSCAKIHGADLSSIFP
jgi:autophagy-related protein 11